MPVLGQTPTEVHLNATTPSTPEGAATVEFQAGDAYPDPNDPTKQVRDVSAYVPLFIGATESPEADGVAGAVPAPAAEDAATGKFLKADGTWKAPAAGSTPGGDLSGDSSSQEVIGIQAKPIDGGPTDGDALVYSAGSGKWEPTALVPQSRLISTTTPVTGGGDLSADRTIAVSEMTGDSGGGGTKGLIPAPPAGSAAAGKFFKADGTYALPPTSGAPFSGRTGDGSTGHVKSALTYAYGGGAVSLHFWFKPNAVPSSPGTNKWQAEWGIFDSGNDYPLAFNWDGGNNGPAFFQSSTVGREQSWQRRIHNHSSDSVWRLGGDGWGLELDCHCQQRRVALYPLS